jgi:hypothetical protein
MSLTPYLEALFKTDEAISTVKNIRQYGSKCSSLIEFGVRGGGTAVAFFQALLDGATDKKWMPRYVGVDLVNDESIKKLELLAEKHNISFEFWQGHTTNFPAFRADALVWDTFHCGGALSDDLERLSPHIDKYIFILGVRMYGIESEAVKRNLNLEQVAKEIHSDVAGARKGMRIAISEFISKHSNWTIASEFAELTILAKNSLKTHTP